MHCPYLFRPQEKSPGDKNHSDLQTGGARQEEAKGRERLQTQQRVKKPRHASLDRKNAFADGLGQIIFTLDVYRCAAWTSYSIKSRVALDPPSYPTCPQPPRGSARSPFARFIVSTSAPLCNSIRVHLTRVHRKFSLLSQVAQTFREHSIVLNSNVPRSSVSPPLSPPRQSL